MRRHQHLSGASQVCIDSAPDLRVLREPVPVGATRVERALELAHLALRRLQLPLALVLTPATRPHIPTVVQPTGSAASPVMFFFGTDGESLSLTASAPLSPFSSSSLQIFLV